MQTQATFDPALDHREPNLDTNGIGNRVSKLGALDDWLEKLRSKRKPQVLTDAVPHFQKATTSPDIRDCREENKRRELLAQSQQDDRRSRSPGQQVTADESTTRAEEHGGDKTQDESTAKDLGVEIGEDLGYTRGDRQSAPSVAESKAPTSHHQADVHPDVPDI